MIMTGYRYIIVIIFLCLCTLIQAQNEKNIFADTTILLQEVEVSSYRITSRIHDIPGSISVLNLSDKSLSGGINLSTLINSVPGLTMQTGTYSTSRIIIRGMGSRTPYNTNRIRTYLNDIPMTTSDGISTPEEFDIHNLGKIEIIKGPASALYGSGLGGSINMFTPQLKKTEGSVIGSYESFKTGKINVSGSLSSGNAVIWTSLGYMNSEGYRENNHYKRYSLINTLKWNKDKYSISSTFLHVAVNAGIPSSIGISLFENNPVAAASNWKAVNGFEKYNRIAAGLTFSYKVADNVENGLIFFSKWNNSYEKRPFNNLDDRTTSFGFREKISFRTDKTDFIAGTELIYENYGWKLDTGILINRNREKRKHLNIFTIVYFKPVKTINISVAAALNKVNYILSDQFSGNGDQSGKRNFPLIFSPRLGINYSPAGEVAFFASAGHGFSFPSPEETLLPEGNVNRGIRPEQGFQYEAGLRLNLIKRKIGLEATFYLIQLDDLLVTKRITEDIFTGINAGKTRHKGVELSANMRVFDSGKLPGILVSSVSYSSSVNRFIEFTDEGVNYDGKNLPGIPSQTMQFQLRWKTFSVLELTTVYQYTGKQYLNDLNSVIYNSYSLINFRLSAELSIRKDNLLRVFTGLNNATNTRYSSMFVVNARAFEGSEPRYYYPGLPLNVYAGAELRF